MSNIHTLPTNSIQPIYPIVKAEDGALVHQTPEQFSAHYFKGDGLVSDKVRQGVASISKGLAELNLKRTTAATDYEGSVKRTFAESSQFFDEARAALKVELKELGEKLADKTGFKIDAARRSYVVGTFAGLSPNERVTAVSRLIEEGHGPELAILAEASGVFTGLPDELRKGVADRYFKAREPALFAKLGVARQNQERLEAASIVHGSAYAKFSAPLNRTTSQVPEVHRSVAG